MLNRYETDIWSNNILHDFYKIIPATERKCLLKLAKKWKNSNLLENRKVLLNCHLTTSTLVIIDLLLLAGADVSVTVAPELAFQTAPFDILKKSGVSYIPYETIYKRIEEKDKFDILLDCGAGLLNKTHPRIGTVELTHTDSELYKLVGHPVITVDNTTTKEIETYYGTGDGFIRAISKIFNKKNKKFLMKKTLVEDQSEINRFLFLGKKYVVFGYGKVGKGIVSSLMEAGTRREDVVIIDVSLEACQEARLDNYVAIRITDMNKKIIINHIKSSFCVVTATGCIGSMSEYFDRRDFPENVLLANMGTPDEWGGKFRENEILNNKKPVNFSLINPTRVRYLDPTFQAFLIAVELLISSNLKPGLHNFPTDIDQKIHNEWKAEYLKKKIEAISYSANKLLFAFA